MSNPRAACGAVEGFVRPSLRCSKSILHMILNLTFLMQVILSANLLCLLPFFLLQRVDLAQLIQYRRIKSIYLFISSLQLILTVSVHYLS